MAISQSTSLAPCATQSPVPTDFPSLPQFEPRQLKIGDVRQTHEPAPFLRLSGKWLAEAGFKIGSDVLVTVTSERLVIEPKAPDGKSENEIREARRAAVAMLAQAAHSTRPPARASQDSPVASRQPSKKASVACSNGKTRRITQTRGTWPERIGAAVEPALGDVLAKEGSRLKRHPLTTARHAQVSESRYRAFARGDSQPNLSMFIAIAWSLDQDPRELFDKLLLQIGLQPGTRPVISPQKT